MVEGDMMSTPHPHSIIHRQALDFWVARGAVLMVVVLQLLVINDLSFGPRWLAPTIELAMLAPLSVGTAWTQVQVPAATTDHHWQIIERHRLLIRRVALLLTAVMSVMNCGALIDLVRALLHGLSANGTTLLIDALNIWVTNVIIFALWFWNIDRGGPPRIGFAKTDIADFLFPQMTLSTRGGRELGAGFCRLPVPVVHQRDGILPDRHDAADGAGKDSDDGRGDRVLADRRSGRCEGSEHPYLMPL